MKKNPATARAALRAAKDATMTEALGGYGRPHRSRRGGRGGLRRTESRVGKGSQQGALGHVLVGHVLAGPPRAKVPRDAQVRSLGTGVRRSR
jgi:hypothetical protein